MPIGSGKHRRARVSVCPLSFGVRAMKLQPPMPRSSARRSWMRWRTSSRHRLARRRFAAGHTIVHPPLAVATEHRRSTGLAVTGTVIPDVSRAVPVVALATGRVIEIKARLGEEVQKGQVLLGPSGRQDYRGETTRAVSLAK